VKYGMGRVCRMATMNGKYATAAWYVCGVWHKVAYRSLSVTPSVGAFGFLLIMLPCFYLLELHVRWDAYRNQCTPPPHVGCRVTVSSTLQFQLPAVTFHAQRLSVCVVYLSSTSSLST